MKVSKLQFPIVAAAVVTLATTGCYTRREIIREPAAAVPAAREVIVETPPAPQVETISPAPSPEHVWIPGHWVRSTDRWIWSTGHWELRPSPTSVYTPGHWEKRGDGYIWREGQWK